MLGVVFLLSMKHTTPHLSTGTLQQHQKDDHGIEAKQIKHEDSTPKKTPEENVQLFRKLLGELGIEVVHRVVMKTSLAKLVKLCLDTGHHPLDYGCVMPAKCYKSLRKVLFLLLWCVVAATYVTQRLKHAHTFDTGSQRVEKTTNVQVFAQAGHQEAKQPFAIHLGGRSASILLL